MPKALGTLRSENFKKILDELKPKVTGDNKDEVISALGQLDGVFQATIQSLRTFGTENEEKRIANNQLEKDKLKLTNDNKTLTDNATDTESAVNKATETLKTENETLKKDSEAFNKYKKSEFMKRLGTAVKHPNWDNVKEKFAELNLGEITDKDGVIDPEKITPEMINGSDVRLTDLFDAGLFGKVDKKTTPSKNTPGDGAEDGDPVIKTREDLSKNISSQLEDLG